MLNWLKRFVEKKADTGPGSSSNESTSSAASEIAGPFSGLDGIRIGRYSDNNKSFKKTGNWYAAEEYYKQKNYREAFIAFFDYLQDDAENNVNFHITETGSPASAPGEPAAPSGLQAMPFTFDLVQGTRKIFGECDGKSIVARASLAVMDHPSTAVMRRLLDLNYTLYYSRSAMDEANTLYMVFDTDVTTASPNKLYYGLRELAIKADRQDDLLLADFINLKAADSSHSEPLPEQELEIKYKYFKKWISDTLKRADELNQDSFSGAIAYLFLGLIYRIDFLITPEAKLLSELEHINSLYWKKKDEVTLVERNRMMKEAVKKLINFTKEDFISSTYRSKATFSIATPPSPDKIREYISNANRDSHWYIDNKYPDLAVLINEYGVLYEEFTYSMPKPITDLIVIYMAVMHPEYFSELGMSEKFYDPEKEKFNKEAILKAANEAVSRFQDKYTEMKWNDERINFNSLYEFGISFTDQIASLNLKTKRS
jgi:hypothetical protein